MNISEIKQIIIPFLESRNCYSTLINLFQTQKTKGYAFELYFAYVMENGGTKLEYERKANGEKTVDFYYSHNGNEIWFELVSPDMNQPLKDNIEQQLKDTANNGISHYEILLTSDHSNPNYNVEEAGKKSEL